MTHTMEIYAVLKELILSWQQRCFLSTVPYTTTGSTPRALPLDPTRCPALKPLQGVLAVDLVGGIASKPPFYI